ncbi:hypothetical protein [Lactiplantibacillus xiangfangensis]|uniref:hypothetical protein n=1 Tax=Lactiplantibacillus xiangfangensis TaxID=942150 RepID=UPI0038510802
MGVEIGNNVRVKNIGDLVDLCNDLSHFVDDDSNKLTDQQYDDLSVISDSLNEWQPMLEVITHYSNKEDEL